MAVFLIFFVTATAEGQSPSRSADATAPSTAATVAANPSRSHGPANITMDFDNVDIQTFIKAIGEITGRNFVIDKQVQGNVTVFSPKQISAEEAYRVFQSVLEVHGYTTVPVTSSRSSP
jgi:general secretion pathway protein D